MKNLKITQPKGGKKMNYPIKILKLALLVLTTTKSIPDLFKKK